jgi:thiol-disulfide isomerase/thioredoxin
MSRWIFVVVALGAFAFHCAGQGPASIASPEMAATAEQSLRANPEDLMTRLNLLFFYQMNTGGLAEKDIVLARRPHILWLIEHHPDQPTLIIGATILSKSGRHPDPEGAASAAVLWKAALAKPAPPAAVIVNAAKAFAFDDRPTAQAALAKAMRTFPTLSMVARTRGELDILDLVGARSANQFGQIGAFEPDGLNAPAALAARAELESSNNPDLLGAAATELLNNRLAIAMKYEDQAANLTSFSEKLLQRAIKLAPDSREVQSSVVSFYTSVAAAERDPQKKVAILLNAEQAAKSGEARMALLEHLCEARFRAGDFETASKEAAELLDFLTENPRYFNAELARHIANTTLGLAALRDNHVDEAKRMLAASGKTTGSPVLNSFGPRWTLAQALLNRGETDAVLEYIAACRVFWQSGQSRLNNWEQEIRAGDTPDLTGFGPAKALPVGSSAYPFRLKNLNGDEVSLQSFRGKIVMLDFWATWCGPCKAEMPLLKNLQEELAVHADAVILTVDADEPAELVESYVKKEHLALPVLLTDGTDITARYGIAVIPTLVFIDTQGRVVETLIGLRSEGDLRASIARARAASVVPTAHP